MSEINLFELATREDWRFETPRGQIMVEHLWQLPLTGGSSLDAVAVNLNETLQKSATKSFVNAGTTADKQTELKLELVKYIIGVRLAEAKAKTEKAQLSSKRKLILEALAVKENEKLLSGSIEDLQKRLEELK